MKSGPTSGPLIVSSQRHPAVPGHRTARAVHLRAVEAGEGVDDLAVPGDLDRGRAAAGHRVVGLGRRRRTPGTGLFTSWLRTSTTLPVAAPEGGHAVVAAGQHGAVVERDGLLGVVERPVLEPAGQVQAHDAVAQVGHRAQRDRRRRSGRCGEESGEGSGQRRAARGGRRAQRGSVGDRAACRRIRQCSVRCAPWMSPLVSPDGTHRPTKRTRGGRKVNATIRPVHAGRDESGGRGPRSRRMTSGRADGPQLTGAVAASATSVGPWPFCVPPALPLPASAMPAPSRFEKAMAPSSTTRAMAATT